MTSAPELAVILKTMDHLGYKVFANDTKAYNLNLIGLRTADKTVNTFNDYEYVLWRFRSSWEIVKFRITTDPGLYYLNNPMNPHGAAIVKPGQYPGMWGIGLHNGKYNALVQTGPCTVIRDFNRDNYLDYNSGREETGVFGIDNHRAVENGRSIMVDKFSAGCMVFEDYYEFEIFMRLISEAQKNWTPSFTYSLITEAQLVS